ncbi:uncharacterized protein [Physcomitrium patens]|uniref:uncharacterized protein n=1 Tax=Physcomitrium patens TaxID=3218 RepID=UPI00024AAF7C
MRRAPLRWVALQRRYNFERVCVHSLVLRSLTSVLLCRDPKGNSACAESGLIWAFVGPHRSHRNGSPSDGHHLLRGLDFLRRCRCFVLFLRDLAMNLAAIATATASSTTTTIGKEHFYLLTLEHKMHGLCTF